MDAYRKMILMMQRQGAKSNTPGVRTGKVTSPPPNLVIEVDNMPLYSDDIIVSHHLLDETVTTFNEGDKVAIMPTSDFQTWIVLAKVVRV